MTHYDEVSGDVGSSLKTLQNQLRKTRDYATIAGEAQPLVSSSETM